MKALLLTAIIALIFPAAAKACNGQISDGQKEQLATELDQDLMETKLPYIEEADILLSKQTFDVGSRGNCQAVTMTRFLTLSFTSQLGQTCKITTASQLKQGYPAQDDSISHIVSATECQ